MENRVHHGHPKAGSFVARQRPQVPIMFNWAKRNCRMAVPPAAHAAGVYRKVAVKAVSDQCTISLLELYDTIRHILLYATTGLQIAVSSV